jgi:serine/threonine-protein kinase
MSIRIVLSKPRWNWRLQDVALAALWLIGGAGLLALVFGVSFYLAMRSEMRSTVVNVPDLSQMTLEEASVAVEPYELVLEVVDQRHDPTVASGRVLQQIPRADSSVRRGRKLKLVLSLGGRVLEVPDLIGEAARAVEIELRQEGFIPGDEARVASYASTPGSVIAQVPPAGTPSVPSARVHRLVSNGPPEATWVMPDLSGLSRAQAERWISASGFRRGALRRVRMNDRPAGTVVGQLPLAGYPIHTNDVVEITVAQ